MQTATHHHSPPLPTHPQLLFRVRLEAGDTQHLGCVRLAELHLPPPQAAAQPDKAAQAVLSDPALRQRSAASLAALHNVPLYAVVQGQACCWPALRRLAVVALSLQGPPVGVAFSLLAFPPALQQLDLPVPSHPFPLPAGLPRRLQRLTLRCRGDFIASSNSLPGPAPAAAPPHDGAPPERHWQQLEIHAGRTAGLDLDNLPRVGAASLTLRAPLVMVATSEPSHPALVAAPPVRSLTTTAGQYLALLAPGLAAAGIAQLRLVATELSCYLRQPGRRAIIDATALPPAGEVQAPGSVQGYTARLAWPATADGGEASGAPYFCLGVARGSA